MILFTDGWARSTAKYGNSSGEDSSDSDNDSPPNGTAAAPEQVGNGWMTGSSTHREFLGS